ncbi:MAG: acyl-CoA dehydrogenase family protein, partial [Actinobacteria bacterium]|nr:acyl-CoA dehydrogenase family protein [Actinomycetota bacterium]
MNFNFNQDDELLAETLRDYALRRLAPDMGRWRVEDFPRDRVQELGALGVLGIRIDPEHGGSQGDLVSVGIAAEELSRGDFNVSYFVQLATIGSMLLARADQSIQRTWLPAIASGDRIVAFGLTEPGVGSDAANLTMSARADGETWLLNGEKASITFAGNADACVV